MSPRAQRRRRVPIRGDKGLSLAELLITMLLLGIVGTVVVSQFTAVTGSLQTTDRRIDNSIAAQQAMEVLIRDLRAGGQIERVATTPLDAFAQLGAREVTLHSYVGPRPSRVRFFVDGQNRLIEESAVAQASSTPPFWTFPTTATTTVVARGVANTAAQPIFTFRDATGAALTVPSADPAVLRLVRSVDVSVRVQTDPLAQVPAAVLDHEVFLPNLEVN